MLRGSLDRRRSCGATLPDILLGDWARVRQVCRSIHPLDDGQDRTVIRAVLVLHGLNAGALQDGKLAGVITLLRLPLGVDILEGVGEVDRVARELRGAAKELLALDHHHEAALGAFTWRRRRRLQVGIDPTLGRLTLLEPQPAGGDVVEVGDKGRVGDFPVSAFIPQKPSAGLGVVFDKARERGAGAADIESHVYSPFAVELEAEDLRAIGARGGVGPVELVVVGNEEVAELLRVA